MVCGKWVIIAFWTCRNSMFCGSRRRVASTARRGERSERCDTQYCWTRRRRQDKVTLALGPKSCVNNCAQLVNSSCTHYKEDQHVDVPSRISTNVTISTMPSCAHDWQEAKEVRAEQTRCSEARAVRRTTHRFHFGLSAQCDGLCAGGCQGVVHASSSPILSRNMCWTSSG